MSHEIRTPMSAIIGMLELFSYSRLSADQREMLTAARESSRSLLTLIDDILDFSKIEVGKLEIHPQPCSVARLVEGVNATFEHLASGKGLLLTQRVDPALWPAHLIDPSRLRQVLNNLVSNAIKFTHAGTVSLEVKVLEARAGKHLGSQTLCFSVQDSGIGMSAQTQRHLFEPFQQGESETSRRYGGTGLGLAISRQLVGLMGGTIQVTSTEGLGTRVLVTLAAERASAAARDDLQATSGGRVPIAVPAPPGTRLLVVDDHPVNLAMLKRQLKVLGLEVDTATSGLEALAKWRRERHSLVITDLQMPEMDGYAFARAIRAEPDQGSGRKPMVVAFTANTQRESLEQCIEAGMDDYLTKPAELVTLRAKLVQWLGGNVSLGAAPSAAARRASPIDRARIQQLAGGPQGIAEVLAELESGVRADIAALQVALESSDPTALRRAAHRIKGSALTIGAERLAGLASQVVDAPPGTDTPQLMASSRALLEELGGVLDSARVQRDAP